MQMFHPSLTLCSTLIWLMLALINIGEARWATHEDAAAEMEFFNRDITTNAEGKSEEIIEQQIKVLNERGRAHFGTLSFVYNSSLENIEIIEAKAIHQGTEFKVTQDMIENKPIASQPSGFDKLYQVLVSYPQVQPGSQLYVKYKITTYKQPIAKSYTTKGYFGQEAYWKKATISLRSEIPFKVLCNDPQNCLEIRQDKDKKHYKLTVNLKKPVYNAVVNEPHNSLIPPELTTWFSVSTFSSPEDVAKGLVTGFEDVLKKDLPALLSSIKEEAAKLDYPVAQFNRITSLLSEKIRYRGDWRTVEGRFAPRPLATTAETGYGDCKDFATATVAVLRALGYKAHVALVMRDATYIVPTKQQPSLDNYNHAIVHVIDSTGKAYWLDPTNLVSMAEGTFPDIADRPALILDPAQPSIAKIPGIDPHHAGSELDATISLSKDGVLTTDGNFILKGENALMLTAAGLSDSLKSIEEALTYLICDEASPAKKKLDIPPLKTRIVEDVVVRYNFEQHNKVLSTNLGHGIFLKMQSVLPFIDIAADQVGTLHLGYPYHIIRKTLIKNAVINGIDKLKVDINTPWLSIKRDFHLEGKDMQVTDNIIIKKNLISPEEIRSNQYKAMRDTLKKYCAEVALILSLE